MSTLNFIEIIMWASFLIVLLFYIGYFLILYFSHNRVRNYEGSLKCFNFPTVSLIVPVYNEEKIIAKKIQNIEELNYPNEKIEVVFVDGHSTDRTSAIIKNQMQKCKKFIKLIEQRKREGYTRGITEGIANSKGEVIVMTDAGAYHDPDALKHLIKHFENPLVGAVTGKEIVIGNEGKLGPELEKTYRSFYDFMREAETTFDSTPDSKGEILAVRRDICESLATKIQNTPNASFDSCVPYQAKIMGYKTVYDPQAKYYEYAPASVMDRMKQQIRRATVLIGALIMFRQMFLKRKYGKFGTIIMPAHFIMLCLLPWIFLLGVSCLLILTLINPIGVIPLWIVAIGMVAVSRKSRVFLLSFIQSQIALVIAIFRLALRAESLLITTIPSTRK
jgi:cellulose synthase/poly-beta-1,6-N-acetylglucosamine synthase-like glycosyltransferase